MRLRQLPRVYTRRRRVSREILRMHPRYPLLSKALTQVGVVG